MKSEQKLLEALIAVLVIASAGSGTVINENTRTLPPGCDQISGWKNITIHAGTEYTAQFPGTVFTYSRHDLDFEACTKLTVTFVNHDAVRHQWMVHGLPATIYDGGMFTLSVTGPNRSVTGTFILPGYQETLLVHCGVPQHMQKGMKAQIQVAGGDGTLPNIPGVSGSWNSYSYPRESPVLPGLLLGVTGLVIGALVVLLHHQYRSRED